MTLTAPIPFREATAQVAQKRAFPTSMSSRELMQLSADTRERSLFSARTTLEGYLEEVRSTVDNLLNPRQEKRADRATPENPEGLVTTGFNPATAREQLRDTLKSFGYSPDPAKRGTLEDLSSDKRIDLVVRMNTQFAQGYGQWRQGQEPAVLDQWPAQELFRAEDRKEPRAWLERWRGAGGRLFDGRMIALKNDPVWEEISAFGVPYPPFDFNSGMDVRDVDRAEAVALGLIDEDTQIEPQQRGFEVQPVETNPQPAPAPAPVVIPAQVSTPAAATPAPVIKPVSDALRVIRRDKAALEDAKRTIDSVHDDGTLPVIPVGGTVSKKANGVFVHHRNGGPIRIGVRVKPGQEFTFAHEVGHFLDHQTLGDRDQLASHQHPDLQEWRDAIRNSALKTQLQQGLASATTKNDREYFEYLLEPHEFFARSYAQFIAERSQNPKMLAELRARRLHGVSGAHWSDADFAPIKSALEKLFGKKGWLRP